MTRCFVVERKAVAVMPDFHETLAELDPGHGRSARTCYRRAHRYVRGSEWIARQHVLEVGEDQLLMLLLVVHPQLDQRAQRDRRLLCEQRGRSEERRVGQ